MFEQASRVEGLVLVLSLSVGASGSQISRFGIAVEPRSLRGASVSSFRIAEYHRRDLHCGRDGRLHFEYSRIRSSTLEYARVRSSTLEYARVRTSTLEYARVRTSTLEYARVRSSTLEYARVRSSTLEYARVRSSTLEYARVRSSTLEYARLRSSTLEYARVPSSTHEYARVRTCTLENARVRSSTLEYARVRSSALECSRVRSSALEYARVRSSTRIGRRRCIAKTHWIGEDELRRHIGRRRRIGVAKTASGDTLRGYGPGRRDALRSRFHDITATSTMRGCVPSRPLAVWPAGPKQPTPNSISLRAPRRGGARMAQSVSSVRSTVGFLIR